MSSPVPKPPKYSSAVLVTAIICGTLLLIIMIGAIAGSK